MKVSFVSNQAISQAMRYQAMRMQADLVKANKEAIDGRVADVGLALGARAGTSVSLQRDVDRLKGLIDSNQLAASRLEATQISLRELTASAEDLLAAFQTAMSNASESQVARQEADAALSKMTSLLNANLSGEFLFAGINTDVKPIADFLDPASPNRAAFDSAFVTYFGFPSDDPAAADIDAASMDDFLTTVIEPQFLGPDWNTLWSSATDQQISSRITLTETAQTSVSANITGVRKLAMAASIVAVAFDGPLGEAGRAAVLDRSIQLLGQAIVELGNQQSFTGIAEQRIDRASDRMRTQIDLLDRSLGDLVGVDPMEAVTRVNGLVAQLEVSYSLTARMQQLSLLKFL